MAFDVSLEMQSDSKNYVSVQDDNRACTYYKIGTCLTLENLRLHRPLEIFKELLRTASFKPNEKM